jgi:putative endonuclease
VYCVYLIKSKSNNKIYIGFTSNLKKRLTQHNENKGGFTKGKGPWNIVYCEFYKSKEDAETREKRLKYFGQALGQLKRRLKNSLL